MNPARVDLAAIFRELEERYRPGAVQKNLAFEVAVPPAVELVTDEFRLKQILINLLSNAVKFTTEGGSGCGAA